jgi:hypothetical protein
MVMTVQCPNPKCKRFMLVEDHERSKVVPCLLCKTGIKVSAGPGAPPTPPPVRRKTP